MKVRTRLMIILTIAVIVTLSVWYIDMLNLAKLNKATATIDEVFLPSVENILNADRDLYQVYVAELELFDAVPGSPEWDRYTKEIKDNFQQVVDRVNGYAELATTQEQRNIVAQHVAARDKWKVELDKYIRLLEQGTPEARQQARLIREQVAPLFESTREPLNTLTDASLEMSEKTKNEARDIYSNARKVSLIVIATGMIILLLLIIILLRSITIPLNLAVDHLGLIASGDFTRPVSDNLLRMKDEIGKVARAIDRLQANLRPLLSGLRDDAKTLAGNSEALSASSEEIASSSGEVAKAIQQVAAGAGEQSNHLQEILGLIENITSSLEKVYTELGQVKANSEETS
ncbi:MCP four helix bundle domain-containing protein, partial [Neomoorella mulderi]|uniref:MCP four helix bundle domain-containing protein n=1 Tax=Neomoorella mulderi TaxID=202604 RepID=UPI000A8E4476